MSTVGGVGADGFSSWWGSSSTLIFAFGSGGPVLLIYGFLFMAVIASCIAVSLGELASAYPNSGNPPPPPPDPSITGFGEQVFHGQS